MKTYDRFDNKRILVWGYGREGKSTADFLSKYCRPASIEIFEGKREEIREDEFDFMLKCPGSIMEAEYPK